MQFSIIKNCRIWFTISGFLIAVSIVAIAVFGFNFGIDFTGGSIMEIRFPSAPDIAVVRATLAGAGYEHAVVQPSGTDSVMIRLESLDETAHQSVLSALKAKSPRAEELKFDSFGPSVGSELRKKTITGVIIVLVLIGVYIAFAFRKVSEPIASWKYGLLTILAGFHDVVVPMGLFATLGHFLGWQVDTAFVAAALTILGYSINDTIVVFDRTRENLPRRSGDETFEDVVEKSIRQTITRSLYTTLTTMLVLAAIFIFGGDTTRPFALALLVGIGIGAYSSVFIASPLLVAWEGWRRGG